MSAMTVAQHPASKVANVRTHELWAGFQQIEGTSTEGEWRRLLQLAQDTAATAFTGGAADASRNAAELALHRVLYALYAGRIAVPWTSHWRNLDYYRFDQLRQVLEHAWAESEEASYGDFLGPLPTVADFPAWATRHCQGHRSNVTHPLFDFLRDTATFDQLREFIIQETPFDIHFGDILAKMLPGVYGDIKSEFSKNFWDEMGRSEAALMHRQLRLDMMQALGEADDVYISNIERFCLEELRLANMYFHAALNRALLPQAIGMMLATELMVPGRLDQQILGWRRIGWPDAKMHYLIVHTVVDIEHARGWMEKVVIPILQGNPDFMSAVALGIARRLEHAGAVCDKMMQLLPAVHAEHRVAAMA
jgi:pyrroloquinoline quinone (PQQ) biosynthesis protein C